MQLREAGRRQAFVPASASALSVLCLAPGALEGEPPTSVPLPRSSDSPGSLISHLPTPSVASAMHGDSHDRYERLTSVSSSVDFDQRDNVSALPQTC